jgi:hypothetical protein
MIAGAVSSMHKSKRHSAIALPNLPAGIAATVTLSKNAA